MNYISAKLLRGWIAALGSNFSYVDVVGAVIVVVVVVEEVWRAGSLGDEMVMNSQGSCLIVL